MNAGDFLSASIDFHSDRVRNIPGSRHLQHLFDDPSEDPDDWEIATAIERDGRIAAPTAAGSLPFDFGTVISYSFASANWQATRYSDGTTYGVWYGSLDVETTVRETAWHWYRFVFDSYAAEDREIVTERSIFDVRCDALLVDLRGKEVAQPDLVSRTSYAFTQRLGHYQHEQGSHGLLACSARGPGFNAAILRQERLSNARHRAFLTYRLDVVRDRFVAQRTPRRTWIGFAPSELG